MRAALLVVVLSMGTAGCAFEGQIAVQQVGDTAVVVKQSAKVEFAPHRVKGVTTRAGQVVKVDCSVTGIFDVREATGSLCSSSSTSSTCAHGRCGAERATRSTAPGH